MNAAQPTALVPTPAQARSVGGIGASEGATAIGVNPYQRPIDAWLRLTGRAPAFAGNEATFWGQALEPVIRAHYVERNNVVVHVPPESLWHPELAWLKATPDGIVIDEQRRWQWVAPQVKSVGLRMADRWAADQVPDEYVIQAVIEMAVTNLDRLDFAVLIGAQTYAQPTVHRDREFEAAVLEQLAAFWKCVETDTPPEIDDSNTYRAHLLKQIKRRAMVEASPTDVADLERWRDIAVLAKKLKAEERGIKTRIAASLSAANAHHMTSDIGDIKVGAPRRKTSYKDVAEQLGPALVMLGQVERELEVLRAQVADGVEHAGDAADAVQRIDSMRAGLRLVRAGGLQSLEAVIATHTTTGEPVMNRPCSWTKGVPDADEDEES